MTDYPTESIGPEDAAWPGQAVPSGTQIGPYHLLKPLGVGGMGQVWLAEQTVPVVRRVALKLIRAGLDSAQVVSRFEAERQALAIMAHPGIAQVFDAGSTPEGMPYFVMELVAGVPITDYCDRHALHTDQRVALFLQVCDAIQHAHQKAILHRDLKPNNVLVAEKDGKPLAKIIDFGLAKALGHQLSVNPAATEFGTLLGTPEYMSPEQADLQNADIDTRTDVYSLGVILYELLAGELPISSTTLRSRGYQGILKILSEMEPPRPSTRLKSLGPEAAAAAKRRGLYTSDQRAALRGDLDWIVMKAMAKDRARRYGSPFELAQDLRRHLVNQPVEARPPSAAYRMGKFVRRHRGAVAAFGAIALLLATFTGVLALQVRKVAAERDRANQEVRTSGQVVDFLTGLFKSSDPTEAKGKDVTARQLLDRGRERIPALQEEPLVQADLLAAMASSYESLGLPDIALDLNRRALDLRMTLLGPGHRKSIAALGNLANCYLDLGRFQEAEPYYRRSLELRRRTLGEDDPSTLRALGNLAGLESELQHPREAVRLFRETLAGFQRIGKVDREAWNYQNNLAKVLLESGRPDESATLAAASLEAQRRVLGPDHPDVLHSLLNLGLARAGQGRNGEALALLEEAWSKARAILGQDHPLALRIGTNLAVQLAAAGHAALAEHLYREVLPIEQAHLGPYALLTLQTENNLGVLLTDHGQLAEAERLLEAVEEGYRKNFGDRDPLALIATYNRAALRANQGRKDEAFRLLDQILDLGFAMAKEMDADESWNKVRTDPRFVQALARARGNAAQAGSGTGRK